MNHFFLKVYLASTSQSLGQQPVSGLHRIAFGVAVSVSSSRDGVESIIRSQRQRWICCFPSDFAAGAASTPLWIAGTTLCWLVCGSEAKLALELLIYHFESSRQRWIGWVPSEIVAGVATSPLGIAETTLDLLICGPQVQSSLEMLLYNLESSRQRWICWFQVKSSLE